MLNRIPQRFRNFYVIAGTVFVLWMLFLDNNDLISRFKLRGKLKGLNDEKAYYDEKIKEVEKDRQELFGDKESVEKFAREKYLMKKETEDIYIIKEE